MKLVINEKLINRNKIIGQATTFGSLAVLLIGLVLAFSKNDTNKMILSYIALVVGFILSQVGIYYTNRYGRTPRLDEIISANFEKLSNEYTFYVYTSPIPLLLIGPAAIWIPMPVTATGKISYIKGRWRQQGTGFLMKAFGQEGLGKPVVDAEDYKKTLSKHLFAKLGSEFQLPEMKPILVLMMKNAEIGEVEDAPIPMVKADKLRRYIRHYDRHVTSPLSIEIIDSINNALSTNK